MKTKNLSAQNKSEKLTTLSFCLVIAISIVCVFLMSTTITSAAKRTDGMPKTSESKTAKQYQEEGNYKLALKLYSDRIKKNNHDYDAIFQMAECKIQLGKYQSAINDYIKYMNKTNDNVLSLKQIALTILKSGQDPWEVIEVADIALAIDSTDFDLFYYKGAAQYEAGLYKEAKNTLTKVASIGSNNVDVYKYLGLTHAAMKEYGEAIEITKKAIVLDSKSAGAYYNVGLFYKKMKDYHNAYVYINNAVELGYKVDKKTYKKLYKKFRV